MDGMVKFMKIRNYLIILGVEFNIFSIIGNVFWAVTRHNPGFISTIAYFVGAFTIVFFLTGTLLVLKIIKAYKEKYSWVKFLYILVFAITFTLVLFVFVAIFVFIPQSKMKLTAKELDLSLPENKEYLEYISEDSNIEAWDAYELAIAENSSIPTNFHPIKKIGDNLWCWERISGVISNIAKVSLNDYTIEKFKFPDVWRILFTDVSPDETRIVMYGKTGSTSRAPTWLYINSLDNLQNLKLCDIEQNPYKLIWATDTQILAFAHYDSDNYESTEHPGYVYVIDVE
jgi:hypothetical protein